MGFWDGITGEVLDNVIPDNTKANAMIQRIEEASYSDFDKPWFYNVQWKIANGPYKGRVVFQKLHVNEKADIDEETNNEIRQQKIEKAKNKSDRAKNILMSFYKLRNFEVPVSIPTKLDLAKITGCYYGIVIKTWETAGQTGNWISSVALPYDSEPAKKPDEFNDDIAF